MNADIVVTIHGRDSADLGRKIEAIDALARMPQEMPPEPDLPSPPIVKPPIEKAPYFDIGSATGKAGDIVNLVVEAGCRFPITGFHIGGGCGKHLDPDHVEPGFGSGYGKFEAIGVKLGAFLTSYLNAEDLIHDEPNHQHDHFWSAFNMVKSDPHRALPEEWWEYAIGFFSIDQERTVPPTTIPSGTKLFTLNVKILTGTASGTYVVTCLDEHYYTQSRQRRRDFLYTANTDSPFARGGVTKLDLTGGTITVEA